MLPPPALPKLVTTDANLPRMNIPNSNNVRILGPTQGQGAYLVQAVVAPLPQMPDDSKKSK